MTALLSRHAECLFWFGRYTERTTCLARLLEVHASITQGRTGEGANWAWILTLYSDWEHFNKAYDEATAENIIRFYVTDTTNSGSMRSSIQLGRENARTLRALLPTELWQQVNTFYNRFRELPAEALSEDRLSRTCQLVKKECYAQVGVAEATLYRDPASNFFRLGVLVERADQMSRLLDVRFAQVRNQATKDGDPIGDFAFWSLLLRSAAAQQSFLRKVAGRREPEMVARFLIFDHGLPRSIAHCVREIHDELDELRSGVGLHSSSRALEQIDVLHAMLHLAARDKDLIDRLHTFNDSVQQQLMALTSELAYAFFGQDRPEDSDPATAPYAAEEVAEQSQSQSEGDSAAQSQSQGGNGSQPQSQSQSSN